MLYYGLGMGLIVFNFFRLKQYMVDDRAYAIIAKKVSALPV